MMERIQRWGVFFSVLSLLAMITVAEEEKRGFSYELWERVLAKHVDAYGAVDYAGLKKSPTELELFIAILAEHSPESHPSLFPGENHRLAYWINAYNANVLRTIIDHYPVASITDIPLECDAGILSKTARFFRCSEITLGGKVYNLQSLEDDIIRQRFLDPRYHFALNCASRGCPRLPRKPFVPEQLDAQLDAEARRFLADPNHFRFNHRKRKIELSTMFQWYEEDFTRWLTTEKGIRNPTIIDYIRPLLTEKNSTTLDRVARRYRIRYLFFDWSLND